MSEQKTALELKKEEIDKKAEELSVKYATKVHAFMFKGDKSDDDFVIGYMKEPARIVKSRAIDKMHQGMTFSVGDEVVEACLIKEESDPRITSELSENDNYALGATKFAGELIKFSVDQLKKK